MDTHRLRYFLRVAEEGSITRAAYALGIAQPALSRQIRLLEEDLAVALFRRIQRGVELTEDGKRLRAATAAPLRQLELAVRYAASPLARLQRDVVVGLIETTVDVLAVPLFDTLNTTFPDIGFSMTTGGNEQLLDGMRKGAIDITVVNPLPDDRVFYRDLLTEDLVVVGAADSGLDPGCAVAFEDLIDLPLVIPRSSIGIANTLEIAALRMKRDIRYRVSTDSLTLTKHLIAAGFVYGVLPLSAFSNEIGTNRLRYAPVVDPALALPVGIAATAELELPREFAYKLGSVVRHLISRLIDDGDWPARFVSSQPWNPSVL
ncbi:LysR family transcriptional regulator [Nocardia noduli]|uniref:LysR family transcriptional regulator n=1 Tax=Nocardia noduli TaxID=2815722 RepID=UPI001C2323E1|nr:LysR family transcriptional regulator [Nocardia noduli]